MTSRPKVTLSQNRCNYDSPLYKSRRRLRKRVVVVVAATAVVVVVVAFAKKWFQSKFEEKEIIVEE